MHAIAGNLLCLNFGLKKYIEGHLYTQFKRIKTEVPFTLMFRRVKEWFINGSTAEAQIRARKAGVFVVFNSAKYLTFQDFRTAVVPNHWD